jgi:methionyl-tRNA synthetase
MIRFDDFKKLEIKIAEIKEVKPHPHADKLYVMTIDVGEGQKDIIAGIRPYYKPEELIGKKIVVLNNLEPISIRGIESSAMLLAAQASDSTLSIIVPEKDVASGCPVS